jgi:hypothetical protein
MMVRTKPRKRSLVHCGVCGGIRERQDAYINRGKFRFCSKKCSYEARKVGGIIYEAVEPTANRRSTFERCERGYASFRGKLIWYRSSLERRFIEAANSNERIVDLDSDITVRYEHLGKRRCYRVDFGVRTDSGSRVLVEIKPARMVLLLVNLAKFDAARSQLLTLGYDDFCIVTEFELIHFEAGDISYLL